MASEIVGPSKAGLYFDWFCQLLHILKYFVLVTRMCYVAIRFNTKEYMTSITRTVRFAKEEAELIDRFLEKNSILDFSTLARLSITRFIKKPDFQLEAVTVKPAKPRRSSEAGQEQ